MADYGVTARFDPFTMDEMIKPYELMFKYSDLLEKKRELKEAERLDLLDKLNTQDASLKNIANKFPASSASLTYKELLERLSNISEAIASGRFTDDVKREARLLNRDYTSMSLPYAEAYNTWQKKAAEQHALALRNPNTIFDIDYREPFINGLSTLDYIMLNPTGSYLSIDLDAVEANAAKDYYNGIWNKLRPEVTTDSILSKYSNLPESMLNLILQAVINGQIAGTAAYKEKTRTTSSGRSRTPAEPTKGVFQIGNKIITYNITPYGVTIKDVNGDLVLIKPNNEESLDVTYNRAYFGVDDYYTGNTALVGVRYQEGTDEPETLIKMNTNTGKIEREVAVPDLTKYGVDGIEETWKTTPTPKSFDNQALIDLQNAEVLPENTTLEDLQFLADEGLIAYKYVKVKDANGKEIKNKYVRNYYRPDAGIVKNKLEKENAKRKEDLELVEALKERLNNSSTLPTEEILRGV